MDTRSVEVALAEITSSQWGMVTTAQAERLGVSRLTLSRLSEQGLFERVTQGVYLDSGAPGSEFDELKAAWLSTDPGRFAEERLEQMEKGPVVSAESASRLHNVGDLRANVHTFTVPIRRQSQKTDIRYRLRTLSSREVTLIEGLPTTTLERTIADLVDMRTDLSLVAEVLASAVGRNQLDPEYLTELLNPLAARNGCKKGDGAVLLDRLLAIAGLDLDSLTEKLMSTPGVGESLRVGMALEKAIERISQDIAKLSFHSPELAKKIVANSGIANQLSGVNKAVLTVGQHYQKAADSIDLSGLVQQIQSVSGLIGAERKLPDPKEGKDVRNAESGVTDEGA